LNGRFDEFGVLAVDMEVMFYGGDCPTDHTFHNTDRFMRQNGFDLFGMAIEHYSMSSLPFRYKYSQASSTMGGRPVFGDALYVRDICSTTAPPVPERFLTPDKLINAVLLFSLYNLPDCAAEILIGHREKLAEYIDVTVFLDALTKQCISMQDGFGKNITNHKNYMDFFDSDPPEFYLGFLTKLEQAGLKAVRKFKTWKIVKYLKALKTLKS
jgi:hypothetical protein